MLSKPNLQAVCLGLAIAVLTLVCAMGFMFAMINASPLLLLLGPALQRGIILASAGPILVGSFCFSLGAYWYGARPGRTQIGLTTLTVVLTFPLLLLSKAPTAENVAWTLALIAVTALTVLAAATIAEKYPRRLRDRSI